MTQALGPSSGVGRVHSALPFVVDSWDISHGSKPAFLTHAHSDHTIGFAEWAKQPGGSLFCSRETWQLLQLRIPELTATAQRNIRVTLVEGPWEESYTASYRGQSFEVTPMDANHCAGSLMYLFQGAFGTVLHTGDCRLTPTLLVSLKSWLDEHGISAIDVVYLDCTFAAYPKDFPSIIEATKQVFGAIGELPSHDSGRRVYLSCDNLGTEPVLRAISERWERPVYIPSQASDGLAFQGEQSPKQRLAELRLLLPGAMLTSDPQATPFHICGGSFLKTYAAKLKRAAAAAGKKQPLFIRPCVQTFQVERVELLIDPAAGRPGRDGSGAGGAPLHLDRAPTTAEAKDGVMYVLYSNHSSLRELSNALEELRPRHVVPHSAPTECPLHPCIRRWCKSAGVAEMLCLTDARIPHGPTQLPPLRAGAASRGHSTKGVNTARGRTGAPTLSMSNGGAKTSVPPSKLRLAAASSRVVNGLTGREQQAPSEKGLHDDSRNQSRPVVDFRPEFVLKAMVRAKAGLSGHRRQGSMSLSQSDALSPTEVAGSYGEAVTTARCECRAHGSHVCSAERQDRQVERPTADFPAPVDHHEKDRTAALQQLPGAVLPCSSRDVRNSKSADTFRTGVELSHKRASATVEDSGEGEDTKGKGKRICTADQSTKQNDASKLPPPQHPLSPSPPFVLSEGGSWPPPARSPANPRVGVATSPALAAGSAEKSRAIFRALGCVDLGGKWWEL